MSKRLSPLSVSVLAALACTALCSAQANDSCATPEAISGYNTFITSTVGATIDGGSNPVCSFFQSDQIWADVWMCWTAPNTGLATIELCGTTFDTKMAVYPDCACPSEASILACNDDACSLQSRVTLPVTANAQYLIRIGSYSADGVNPPTGSVTLTTKSGTLAEIVNPANDHTYLAYATTTWAAAEATAVTLGSHLVTIDDADENEWIRLNFGNLLGVDRRIWIGYSDLAVEGSFVWADGTPNGYTNWNSGEPNNSGGTEDWAEFLGSNGKWNDISALGGGFAHIAVVELVTTTPIDCPADFTKDGTIDGADLGTLLGDWGVFGAATDLDGDGIVTGADLGMLLGEWGPCS